MRPQIPIDKQRVSKAYWWLLELAVQSHTLLVPGHLFQGKSPAHALLA